MSTPAVAPAAVAVLKPTRARYWVIVFAVTLAVIQYIDRVCISQAMPTIGSEMGLTDAQKGAIFSAFTLAYALFEIPTGWLGDKIGARSVLLRVVLWWSFFTAATGWAWSYVSMLVTRFLFGAGEAGCFPNLTKALGAWLPKVDRTRAQALMWMGARWGGASAPLLVVAVMSVVSWRTAFLIFALLGVAWAVAFYLWFRDNPRDHRAVNAAELALLRENEDTICGHGDVPWGALVTRPTMWLLWGQYFFLSYGWYFFVTWLPTYLKDVRGLEIKSNVVMHWLARLLEGSFSEDLTLKILSAALAGTPLLFGGFGSILAGVVSSRLIKRGVSVALVRRTFGFIGIAGAAALLMASFQIQDALLAMLAMGMAGFFNDLTLPGSWATCMDVGGKYAGTVSGSMNMLGNFGGMAGPLVVGWVLTLTHRDWHAVFLVTSVIYSLGALCWLFIDPVTPLERKAGD
ncbi:MAG TPA: MFS transporter [Lacunisphaera sp.]|jgi:MFS family permease|nr:MFS transporter [Lacunisphaera sp.]